MIYMCNYVYIILVHNDLRNSTAPLQTAILPLLNTAPNYKNKKKIFELEMDPSD